MMGFGYSTATVKGETWMAVVQYNTKYYLAFCSLFL